MAAVMGWSSEAAATESGTVAAQPSLMAPHARVRGVSPELITIINEATARSMTFRGLVDRINSSDGIVYVSEGQCKHGVRACLSNAMTIAGPNRVLRILVDPRMVDRELMGSIGHELQHAVEVLSQPTIRSSSQITLFYLNTVGLSGGRFETHAAIEAGNAVRSELTDTRLQSVWIVRAGHASGQSTEPTESVAPASRLRTTTARIAQLVHDGAARSATFRRLLQGIEQTDSLVYLSESPCPRVRACLLMQLEQSGPNRILRIRITPNGSDRDSIVSIGHELQHAMEVLGDTRVRSTEDMFVLFHRIGLDPPSSPLQSRIRFRFETIAAIATGDAIRDELSQRRDSRH
jgi:hypothetical protein